MCKQCVAGSVLKAWVQGYVHILTLQKAWYNCLQQIHANTAAVHIMTLYNLKEYPSLGTCKNVRNHVEALKSKHPAVLLAISQYRVLSTYRCTS